MVYNAVLTISDQVFTLKDKLAPVILLAKTSSKTAKTSPGSSPILLLVLFILFIGFFVWSRKMRARTAGGQGGYNNRPNRQFLIGDKVVTTFGLVGQVIDIQDGKVDLEISPGVVITVLRHAIGRVVEDDDETFGASAPKWSTASNTGRDGKENDETSTKYDLGEESGKFQAKVDSDLRGNTPNNNDQVSDSHTGDLGADERGES